MTEGSVAERAGTEEKVVLCRHYWIIDSAGGPTSKGVCRTCGVQRQFKNYLEDAPWDDEKPAARDQIASVVSPARSSDTLEEES
ncbi:MAG: hypothetical protein EXR53_03460 [Dehalococcoidia bacterium]|nr:hypothetical protein [Dehalococcoidia bacterium]